jgi:hypothetical protein
MKDNLKQRLAMTTGAAAAALGPVAVQGAVVYTNTSPITATFNTPDNSHDWDVDGAGQLDFTLAAERSFSTYRFYSGFYTGPGSSIFITTRTQTYAFAAARAQFNSNAGGRGFLKKGGGGDDFRRLTAGVAIGPTLASGYGWGTGNNKTVVTAFASTSTNATSAEMYGRLSANIAGFDFQEGQFGNNLIGFRFDIPGGSMHYGWANLFIDDGTGTGERGDVTITEWAYEDTADCAINAGQTSGDNCASGSVPNPGTLLLLAAGAAGLRRWRGQAQPA